MNSKPITLDPQQQKEFELDLDDSERNHFEVSELLNNYCIGAQKLNDLHTRDLESNGVNRDLSLDDFPFGEELVRLTSAFEELSACEPTLEKLRLLSPSDLTLEQSEMVKSIAVTILNARNELDDCTPLPV